MLIRSVRTITDEHERLPDMREFEDSTCHIDPSWHIDVREKVFVSHTESKSCEHILLVTLVVEQRTVVRHELLGTLVQVRRNV